MCSFLKCLFFDNVPSFSFFNCFVFFVPPTPFPPIVDCESYCKASKGKLKINMKKYCKKDYGEWKKSDHSTPTFMQVAHILALYNIFILYPKPNSLEPRQCWYIVVMAYLGLSRRKSKDQTGGKAISEGFRGGCDDGQPSRYLSPKRIKPWQCDGQQGPELTDILIKGSACPCPAFLGAAGSLVHEKEQMCSPSSTEVGLFHQSSETMWNLKTLADLITAKAF